MATRRRRSTTSGKRASGRSNGGGFNPAKTGTRSQRAAARGTASRSRAKKRR